LELGTKTSNLRANEGTQNTKQKKSSALWREGMF